jgi:GntR family transcriptional regulator
LLIVVDENSGVPVYRQIIDQARFQVTAGLVAAGTELPSTRALTQELGVNPMTVSKAYGLREGEGLVVRRPGVPLVVAERTLPAAGAAKTAQLRSLPEPLGVAVRQLGIDDDQALEQFRRVLSEAVRPEESHA